MTILGHAASERRMLIFKILIFLIFQNVSTIRVNRVNLPIQSATQTVFASFRLFADYKHRLTTPPLRLA